MRIAAAGGRCLALPSDALRQAVTDVRTPLGRRHFITPACSPSSPRWTHQSAWQTQPSSPAQHRQHQRSGPSSPLSATPRHPPNTSRTQVSLHPSVKRYYIRQPSYSQPTDHMLMHSDASSLEIQSISLQGVCECACACVSVCVRAYVRQGEKLWRPIKHLDCSFSTSVQLTGERFSENHVQHVPSHLNSTVVMPTMTFMLAAVGIWLLSC